MCKSAADDSSEWAEGDDEDEVYERRVGAGKSEDVWATMPGVFVRTAFRQRARGRCTNSGTC